MLNNISRNMKIINKDILETAWLKCLIDDVPKEKHLAVLGLKILDCAKVFEWLDAQNICRCGNKKNIERTSISPEIGKCSEVFLFGAHF